MGTLQHCKMNRINIECLWSSMARQKSEELSETIGMLRAYERGEYGLEAAVTDLKTAQRQIKTREAKIEELTGMCNTLQLQSSEVLEENATLRDRLGMPPNSAGDTSSNSTIRGVSISVLKFYF